MGRHAGLLIACGALVWLVDLVTLVQLERYTWSVGGRPSNGKVEGDRYYVRNHGSYTEVSEEDWNRGVALERRALTSVALLLPVCLLLAVYGYIRRGARRLEPSAAPDPARDIGSGGS